MNNQRWQMSRAGIFNFWYYDDQEFQLSEGRLILRGANGSGKSVTMQSFLPLVLDGDKRPWRLDPFGSRDRRIEYYLLGDVDSGITERTGYLYLEFYHPEKKQMRTVGIGLRAKRGTKSVRFWGFSILDQRRIGRDFFLYDHEHFERHGQKIPLQADKLTEQLGAGGKVVREQGEYRRLVNQVLFGFEDEEAYQELLDLLIQLRSPKLSKDFKPSTIYDILTEALPPLQEEELRPLSEVLEDMDQISDTLDELSIHRKEVEHLDEAYTRYNQFLLYDASAKVLQARKEYNRHSEDARQTEQELTGISTEIETVSEQLQEVQENLHQAKSEEEILLKHEAIEKQKELEDAKIAQEDLLQQIERSEQRREDAGNRHDSAVSTQQDLDEQWQLYQAEEEEKIVDLEGTARDTEFKEHDLYHRQWEASDLVDASWHSWEQDLSRHTSLLKEAHHLAVKEKETKVYVHNAEREMSEAREERDHYERLSREAEKRLEQMMEEQEGLLWQWFQSLQKLPLYEKEWRNMVHTLQGFPQVAYTEVKQPALVVYEETRDEWKSRILAIEHEMKQLKLEKERFEAECQEWKEKRDPEPPRRESRSKGRHKRLQEGQYGAPLYALCDFAEGLTDETKARIESALEYTGLLDAWVSERDENEWLLKEDAEEFIIHPSPAPFGYTLADVLVPTPGENQGISVERIDQILRTIRLDGGPLNEEEEQGTWLNEEGQFQLGALYGKVEVKPVAQFIGKETREQTRLARIQELEDQIAQIEDQLLSQQTMLQDTRHDVEELQAELEAIPGEETLLQADQARKDAAHDVERAQRNLERKAEVHQQKLKEWRQTQQSLQEKTASWSRLKDERSISEAVDDIQYYKSTLSELKATYQIAQSLQGQINRLHEDVQQSAEQIAVEEELLLELKGRKRDIDLRIETFTQLLEELGILDIHEKLEALKQQITENSTQLGKLNAAIQEKKIEQARVEERYSNQMSQLNEVERRLQSCLNAWYTEWNRGLVVEWREQEEEQNEDDQKDHHKDQDKDQAAPFCYRKATEIERRYRKQYELKTKEAVTNGCLDVFSEVKNVLLDYVLERYFEEETDRLIILSMRDRGNPLNPSVLKEELVGMEEEQRQLLNEKDRELYEQIIIHSVGKAIRHKIYRAESWVKQMNRLMDERQTSSGLKLSLQWEPRTARNERELDTFQLVTLLKKDPALLRDDEIEGMVAHFRSRIQWAKQEAEQQDTLRKWITELLDYRGWFDFTLYFKKSEGPKRQLTDSRFNVLSGGEKAMAMYIPLFAATYSRYSDSQPDSPKIISLDEAFAGVDEENMRDMFQLLTDMEFDYMMTSQVLWGCYDTVPNLSIYEILRPNDVDFVTLIPYYWNGHRRQMMDNRGVS